MLGGSSGQSALQAISAACGCGGEVNVDEFDLEKLKLKQGARRLRCMTLHLRLQNGRHNGRRNFAGQLCPQHLARTVYD